MSTVLIKGAGSATREFLSMARKRDNELPPLMSPSRNVEDAIMISDHTPIISKPT